MVYVRFFLDKKEPKNQERKKLPRSWPAPARLSFRPTRPIVRNVSRVPMQMFHFTLSISIGYVKRVKQLFLVTPIHVYEPDAKHRSFNFTTVYKLTGNACVQFDFRRDGQLY